MQSLLDEATKCYNYGRYIGSAMCIRTILEIGVLDRIRRSKPAEYANVSEKAIQAVINYMHSNEPKFFDKRVDHRVIKCVQSTAKGTLGDVVLLNNIAHGHLQPDRPQLDLFARNLEPLFLWAFE